MYLRNQHSKKTRTQNKSYLLSNELVEDEEATINKWLEETNDIWQDQKSQDNTSHVKRDSTTDWDKTEHYDTM